VRAEASVHTRHRTQDNGCARNRSRRRQDRRTQLVDVGSTEHLGIAEGLTEATPAAELIAYDSRKIACRLGNRVAVDDQDHVSGMLSLRGTSAPDDGAQPG